MMAEAFTITKSTQTEKAMRNAPVSLAIAMCPSTQKTHMYLKSE